jgi:Protein of unknown function (DUF3108)
MQRRRTPLAVALALAALVGLVALGPLAGLARTASSGAAVPAAPGDRYLYRASWNGIPVARAELVIAPEQGAGGAAVRLTGKARTNEFLDLFWRMRDRFDAVVATDPPAPGSFYLVQDENRRRRETWIERDQTRARLLGTLERRGKEPRRATVELHQRLHDPASVAYLIRTLPAGVTEPHTYEVFEGWKIYEMTVTPAGEETITALGRAWRARRLDLGLELVPRDDRPGKNRPPKVQRAAVWVSADAERVLLRMQAPTFWGTVSIDIVGRATVDLIAPAA